MRNRSNFGWFELIEGILLIILGNYTFLHPESGITGFVILYGIMAVIMGTTDILLYIRMFAGDFTYYFTLILTCSHHLNLRFRSGGFLHRLPLSRGEC